MPVNSAKINFPAINVWNSEADAYVPALNTGFMLDISIGTVQINPFDTDLSTGTITVDVLSEDGTLIKKATISLGGLG